ncbi:MAG: IS3 family transposase, partial [Hyphomicrobiales bacterium]|nr:IS3 family transposase [Hyphomicrobiales bacterium]
MRDLKASPKITPFATVQLASKAAAAGRLRYGYRRVGAALRQQGVVVNGKKLRRLMRENGLQPKRRRRYVVTTDSNHGGPIYPDLAKDVIPERPNQLWVADLTYVAIPAGFVYLAAILDAWSRHQPMHGCPHR